MAKRVLITGQRFGKVLILMEIEKRNSQGRYDVIIFCYACNKAKRTNKSHFMGALIRTSCGCEAKKAFGKSMCKLDRSRKNIWKNKTHDKADYENIRPGGSWLKNIR